MIELGKKARDPITGFEGIVIAKTVYLYGCTRVGLQAPIDKDNKIPEVNLYATLAWFDEPQLKAISPSETKNNGGPRPNPRRQLDPNRR